MGQPIHCDAEGCDQLADLLVSRIANGPAETTGWCDPHYVQVCQAIVEVVAQAEAASTDQAAIDRLEAGGQDPTESGSSSEGAGVAPGEPGRPADGPPDAELDNEAPQEETADRSQPSVVREAEPAEPAEV